MGILRLSHVDITVTDLELAAAYYTQVMGLQITERTDDRIFFKCWDERDHHSLAVRHDTRVGLDRFAFKVENASDLDHFAARVEAAGYPVERIADGDEVGQGESIRFVLPSGQEMELVADVHKVGGTMPLLNPPPIPQGLTGIAPPRIDHMLVHAEEVPVVAAFFQDVLDFRLTEQLLNGQGHQTIAFLERSAKPHDIAFVQGPNGALHHFSFWLDDWDHVRRAADILAYNGVTIDVGPPATASLEATRSTSSIPWAPATRSSPAAIDPTPTFRRSPGPTNRKAAPSSITKAYSTKDSRRCTRND